MTPGDQFWFSQEPDRDNPADFVMDEISGIAVTKEGAAWFASSQQGLRIVDHDGNFVADANSVLKTNVVGAIAKDPTDESMWIGYRTDSYETAPGSKDFQPTGLTRIKQDGTVLHYNTAALGRFARSEVWDIQVQPATATTKRRIIVAFRNGAVGIYDGD